MIFKTPYDFAKELAGRESPHSFDMDKEKAAAALRALAGRIEKDEVTLQAGGVYRQSKVGEFSMTALLVEYSERGEAVVALHGPGDSLPVAVAVAIPGSVVENATCEYDLDGSPCAAGIIPSKDSYTGWEHKSKAAWGHFATDKKISGDQSGQFLPCSVCLREPDANEDHFKIAGHKYQALIAFGSPIDRRCLVPCAACGKTTLNPWCPTHVVTYENGSRV